MLLLVGCSIVSTHNTKKHLCSFTEDIFGILRAVAVLRGVRASPAEFLVKGGISTVEPTHKKICRQLSLILRQSGRR